MGAKQSRHRRALARHAAVQKRQGCLFTDDLLSGDLILICENVATGLQSNASNKQGSHALLNPALLKGVQRSQLGKPMHISYKDISGFNRSGIVVQDRLGENYVLEATARGVEVTLVDECVSEVNKNGGVIAVRQVEAAEGRKYNRILLKIMETAKDEPFTWETAKNLVADLAAGKRVDQKLQATAKICNNVLRYIRKSTGVLSVETKAELDQMFSLYDKNGDGTIDEEELETMIDEIAGKQLPTEERLKILTKLDVDNDGGISLQEFYKAMQELPGISSLNDHSITTMLAAHFTLQVYLNIGLLKSYLESAYVDANSLRFDADEELQFQGTEIFPEVPLRVRAENDKKKKSSRLEKIPVQAVRRREQRRKARAALLAEREARLQLQRQLEAQRKQMVVQRDEQIRHQIEQERIFKEREREYQAQLRAEEERKRRAAETGEGGGSKDVDPADFKKQERSDSLLTAESLGDEDPDDAAGMKHDETLKDKDFNSIVLEAAIQDESKMQYYFVDFEARHTGMTIRPTDKEGDQIWVVVDVRPESEADDNDVKVGHLVFSIGDLDLDGDPHDTAKLNLLLRTGTRPLNVSLAAPDAAGNGKPDIFDSPRNKKQAPPENDGLAKFASATVRRTNSGTLLEDGEFEVVFASEDVGFEVEVVVEDDEDPYVAVAEVTPGGEAAKGKVLEDYYIVSIGSTKLVGENCTEEMVAKLLKGKRPLAVVFGS